MEVQAIEADPTVAAATPQAPAALAPPQSPDSALSKAASAAPPAQDAGNGSLPHDLAQHSSLLSSVARTLAGTSVSVSYRVDIQQHDVVTVFKDSASGHVLFQIPAQILEQLASFFDQQSGAVFDRKA